MNHIRLFALGTAAALSLSLLTACGGGKAPVSGSESQSQPDISVVAPDVSVPDVSVEQPDVSAPVVPEPEAEQTLTLNRADFTLKTAGASYKLKAAVTGAENAKVLWASSDEAVATVAEDGTVTAVAAGTAVITAAVEGTELTARCTVRCAIKEEAPVPEERPEEKPETPAPEVKPETPAPEVKPGEQPPVAQDHTQRYVKALNASGSELLQYNQLYTTADPDAPLALEFMGLTPDVVSSFALSFPMMNTKAFGLAAVMPAEGQQQAVVDGLNSYVARMQQTFQRYLPDQYEIALAAKVATLSDGTVVLAMCDDQDTVLANIKNALG